MQKNKRYEWNKMEGCEWIRDTEMVNQPLYYDLETVASLLNQQDKHIKELQANNEILKTSKSHFKKVAENVVDLLEKLNKFIGEPQTRELNYCKVIEDTKNYIEQLKQSQKQLAIEELEKVKELGFIQSYTLDVPNILILKYEDFKQLLDNQIKKLKGEEKMTEVEIENNFTYHAPSADMLPKFEKLRNKAKELSFLINELVPNGREQSLAQTKLQEVVMWANAGIAIPKNNTKQEDLPEYVKKNLHGDMNTVKEQLSEIKDNLELKGYVLISETFNPMSNKHEVIFRRRKDNETR